MEMKFRVLAIFLACAASSVAHAGPFNNFMDGLGGGWNNGGQSRNLDQTLANVSAHLNRDVPITLDADTRLDQVTSEPGHKLTYHYTLTSVESRDIKRTEFLKLVRPPLQARLCESNEMRGFLKHGVTISYQYRSKDGRPLGTARFTASDCGLQQVS
jgi:hypothetical protein